MRWTALLNFLMTYNSDFTHTYDNCTSNNQIFPFLYVADEDFADVKPPSKKSRMIAKDPDPERNPKTSSVVVDLTSSGQRKTQRSQKL